MPSGSKLVFDKTVRFRAECDLIVGIRAAARRRRTLPSEFLRQAIRAEIQRVGIDLDDHGPLFSRGEGR